MYNNEAILMEQNACYISKKAALLETQIPLGFFSLEVLISLLENNCVTYV